LNVLKENLWVQSVGLHLGLFIFIAMFWVLNPIKRQPKRVEFEILQAPKIAKPITDARIAKVAPAPSGRRVFGVSRKAVTVPAQGAPDVKQGNTLGTVHDDKVLNPDDPDALPNAVDEYLVQSMPSLQSEVRVPYPAEAKKGQIQGAVLMDILIDHLGNVREVKLVDGPGHGLNEAAVEAVKNFKFKPALSQEGRSVAVRIRYAYRFILER